jgi:hypothetical protein
VYHEKAKVHIHDKVIRISGDPDFSVSLRMRSLAICGPSQYAVPRNAVPRNAVPRNAVPRNAVPRNMRSVTICGPSQCDPLQCFFLLFVLCLVKKQIIIEKVNSSSVPF